jgi:hypothetical protein
MQWASPTARPRPAPAPSGRGGCANRPLAAVKQIMIGSPFLFHVQPQDPRHRQWVQYFKALYNESTKIRYSS